MKPLVGTAPDAASLRAVTETVRARVAFYLSTPSYRQTFALHGWHDIAEHASTLARAKQWDLLPTLVTDEILHTVATVATHDEIVTALSAKYAGRVDRIEFSMAVRNPADEEILRNLLAELRRVPGATN